MRTELVICDEGDMSVGIFPCTWSVECPFTKDSVDEQTIEDFRADMINVYKEFCEGRIRAIYNFETD